MTSSLWGFDTVLTYFPSSLYDNNIDIVLDSYNSEEKYLIDYQPLFVAGF